MNVFIAGPRAISVLDEKIQSRLDNIINNNLNVLVGDASGVDKAVQAYFGSRNYRNVIVFASKGIARNNTGNWPVHTVEVDSHTRGFDFYAAKDLAMAQDADYGFMIWNGESKGTLNNILNLVSLGKKTVMYFCPQGDFFTINSIDDISEVVAKLCQESTNKLFQGLLKKRHIPFATTADGLFLKDSFALAEKEMIYG
jgi:hypothetical protein